LPANQAVVAEDDRFLHVVDIVLDPTTSRDGALSDLDNGLLTLQIPGEPRFNALDDLAEVMERLSQELAA
jgi:hypothetical protein